LVFPSVPLLLYTQVIDMSLGECAKIHCSPDYAYGPGGFPAWGIMPNSELIFEIEVLSFK